MSDLRSSVPKLVPPAALLVPGALLLSIGCSGGLGLPGDQARTGELVPDAGEFSGLAEEPRSTASSAFWDHWGDGRAELASYRIRTARYGEERAGELVLIYVTEPHDRRRWIKDDDASDPHRVNVLKLVQSLKFLTGIYPYSAMTSVFAPVDDWGGERFSPVKVGLSAQEWCGAVHHQVWPGSGRYRSLRLSYFAGEGETFREEETGAGTLYEDALLIQLRELDGPFAGGGDWRGDLYPSLWEIRRGHRPDEPVSATVERTDALRGGAEVTRFVIRHGEYRRTVDVEKDSPRRILGWRTSTGEEAELIRSERLPYWRMNRRGDEEVRTRLELHPEGSLPPDSEIDSGACGSEGTPRP